MKQREERAVLVQRVKISILIIGVLVTLFSGCKTIQVANYIEQDLDTDAELNYSYFFNEGLKNKNFGNVSKAKSLFEKALEIIPSADAPYYELSLIYNYLGDYENALFTSRKAYKLDKSNLWYKQNLAQNYLASSKLDSAIVIFEELVASTSTVENKRRLALLYEKKGEYKKAIQIINNLESEFGVNEDLSLYKNSIFLKSGDIRNAKKELEKLLIIEPNNLRYITILAETNANAGLEKEALLFYKRALEVDSTYAVAQISLGSYLLKLGETEEAFQYLRKAFLNSLLGLDMKVKLISENLFVPSIKYESNADNFKTLLDILVVQHPENEKVRALYSDHCIRTKDLSGALNQLRILMNFGTDNQVLWEQYLSLEGYFGNNKEIYESCGTAVKKFPNNTKMFFSYGFSAWQLGKNEEAIDILETGLNLVHSDTALIVQYMSVLGEIYNDLERYIKSDYYFENVLLLDQDNVMVLNNYGYYLSLQNRNLTKALTFSKRTIELEPDNSTYLDTYAWILYKLKKYDEALVFIEKAVKNGGINSIAILEHYGDILLENGRKEEAVVIWKMSVEKGNKSETIYGKIEKYSL